MEVGGTMYEEEEVGKETMVADGFDGGDEWYHGEKIM